MMDTLTKEQRSERMRGIRSRDSRPELVVRRLAHSQGYRYRLHDRKLPGAPDLVFPSRRRIIFVHGCFWHRHHCARGQSCPTQHRSFWQEKFAYNVARDERQHRALRRAGWRVLVVWECQTRDLEKLAARLREFLGYRVAHSCGSMFIRGESVRAVW